MDAPHYAFLVYSPKEYSDKIEKALLEKDHVFANREFGSDGSHKHLNVIYKGCKDAIRGWLRRRLKGTSISKPKFVLKAVTNLANTINYVTKEVGAELIKCIYSPEEVDGFKRAGEANRKFVVKKLPSLSLINVVKFQQWYVQLPGEKAVELFGRHRRFEQYDFCADLYKSEVAWNFICDEYVVATGEIISKFQRDMIRLNGESLIRRLRLGGNFPSDAASLPWLCEARAGPAGTESVSPDAEVRHRSRSASPVAVVSSDSEDAFAPVLRRSRTVRCLTVEDTSEEDLDGYIDSVVENLPGPK